MSNLEKKNKLEKRIDFLSKFLPLKRVEATPEVKVFFNLFYAKDCLPIALDEKLQTSLAGIANDKHSLSQIYAIVLSCNSQNVDIFLKMDRFLDILKCFIKDLEELSYKNILDFIEILQLSVLMALDLKSSKLISKHIKAMRNSGIISIHIQKCIEVVLNLYINNDLLKENILDFKHETLANLDVSNSIFIKQNNSLKEIKILLENTLWTKDLPSIFLDIYQKKMLFLGRKKSGKATLIGTMLYRNTQDDKFDSVSPITYNYGDNSYCVRYLSESDLKSLLNSPNKQVFNIVNNALKEFKEEYQKETFSYSLEDLKQVYKEDKIQIVKYINIFRDIDLLKYMKITDTPSFSLTTYRHLQVDRYMVDSDFIGYLINSASNDNELIEDAKYLSDIIMRENIIKVFVIFTKIDKSSFTVKKIKSSYIFLKNTLGNMLNKKDLKVLEKLEVHYTAANIAYDLRTNKDSINSDFDIYSSGLPELERSIVNNIFNTGIHSGQTIGSSNFDISILKNILSLLANNDSAELTYDELKKIKLHISSIKSNYKKVIEKLSLRNNHFHSSLENLKDNLHYQLIDSLNFLLVQKKSKSALNMKKLKKTTIGSLVVALQSLSDIFKQSFKNNENLELIKNILNPAVKDSLFSLCKTSFHKEIIRIIFDNLVHITGLGYSIHRSLIIATHFENRLDSILKDEMNIEDFTDDFYIKQIKESFDYYFLGLERNLDSLFENRVKRFEDFCEKTIIILESIFILYFSNKSFNADADKFLEIFS